LLKERWEVLGVKLKLELSVESWEWDVDGWIGDRASLPLLLVCVRLGLVDVLADRLNMEGRRVRPSELELWPSGGCSVWYVS